MCSSASEFRGTLYGHGYLQSNSQYPNSRVRISRAGLYLFSVPPALPIRVTFRCHMAIFGQYERGPRST